ncbi:hypothetical protein [Janthinobacterium psychrotolerans]|uniref:hypothetical protein n=1 Tax=Janthinobacterium psychrotolerans TaxID=1747903 RepID=UPI0014959E5F|nr:hypothetical protein [Janthinobacterium psychrotolerans]
MERFLGVDAINIRPIGVQCKAILSNNRIYPPFGMSGGALGARGRNSALFLTISFY